MSFDARGLPFDLESMLAGSGPGSNAKSPTYSPARVNTMMDLAARDPAMAGARIERIPGRMGFGDCIRASFLHPREREPGVPSWDISTRSIPSACSMSAVPARRRSLLRAGNLRHEGRQFPVARSHAAIDPRRRRHAAAGHVFSRATRKSARRRRATSSRRKPPARNTCWSPSPAAPMAAS